MKRLWLIGLTWLLLAAGAGGQRPSDAPDVKIAKVVVTLLDRAHGEYEVKVILTQRSQDGTVIHLRSKPAFPLREEMLLPGGLTEAAFTTHVPPVLKRTVVSLYATMKHDGKHWVRVTLEPR